jgi:predicted neuraminidase
VNLPVDANVHGSKIRANQWKTADYDGDGLEDLIVGVGDWADYGWDNAFNAQGEWTRGPLHGFVYLLRNTGTAEKAEYDKPVKIEAGGRPIDVYGMPSPNLADFDGDGDLDLICGEFVDRLTWFENVGTRTEPSYAAGRHLAHGGEPIRADLCMIVPAAIDWDKDGDVDLVMGQEDGRVMFIENTGRKVDGMPAFALPMFFRQEADEVKFGALVTPFSFDWDGDGDEDLVCGNTAGYVGFIENLGGDPPRWNAPKLLEAGGRVLRIEAGPNGSIQGPCEAKWGYTTLSVADWDGDALPDMVVNSIWGKVVWYRNVGTRTAPQLAAAEPVEVAWPGTPPKPNWNWWNPAPEELATQWRTTPLVVDWDRNGTPDLLVGAEDGFFYYLKNPNERRVMDYRLLEQPGIVEAEFVFDEAPFPQCHASTIAIGRDGPVAAWFGGTREKNPDVGIWLSRKGDSGWTPPVEVADGVEAGGTRYPCWNPVLAEPPDGPLLLFYKVGPSPSTWWGMLVRSQDGGRTWSKPERLPDGIVGPIKNKPVFLTDGSMLCGSSTEDDGWRVHMEQTADLGKTWSKTGPLCDGRTLAAIQPSILLHGDAALQILCRTRQGKISQAWSSDGGRTWGEMTLTGLPNPNSGIDAVTLQGGRHLLVYNHSGPPPGKSGGPRSPLNVAVSGDGRTWQAALVLEQQPGEYSYPAAIQAPDGLVHVVYTYQRRKIKHVVIDPAGLVLRDMPDGNWPK